MVGCNCSIYGCTESRNKTKIFGFFKIPSKDDDYSKEWREKLIDIITRDRVVDSQLKQQIQKKNLFICERHYREDQINRCKFIFNCKYFMLKHSVNLPARKSNKKLKNI